MTNEVHRFEKRTQSMRVLLVEDDASDKARIVRMLNASEVVQFEIEHCHEVELALKMLLDESFDVVLLDLTLPEGDGLDTLARAKVAAASVPIITLASEEDERQQIDAIQMGAQDCLIKTSVESTTLVRTLRHAVERHQLVAELQQASRREHFLATHDSLTGLPNRYALEEELGRALALAERSGKQVGLLFLDLDRFKNINDSMGHPVGDELLRLTAERLTGLVRKCDMLARLGGDEFILLVQGVENVHALASLAQKVLERLSGGYRMKGGSYSVTGSIGIAVGPRDGIDRATLIRSADMAMYRAKAQGGNCCQLYNQSMNDAVTKRFTIECRLRDALRNGNFRVAYQPKVEFASNRIVGCEALLRWADPELGDVSPADFIPLAEETGLIYEIGEYVLRTACRQMKQWHEAGHSGLRLAVNLSTNQVFHRDLREMIVDVLWETGLDAGRLELELTESVLIRDPDEAVEVLRDIRQMGIHIALDDFGTGFSSLSYLKAIPIDAVKIDQSFVRDLSIDPDDAAIVGAILSIAEKLELEVVAEGVETEKQRALLAQAGCDLFQGFLVSPAVSPEAFLKLLEEDSS